MCNFAYVVKIGDRYFSRFGKKGQVQTAWHLAGATFFMNKANLEDLEEKLQEKGKSYQVVKIGDEAAFKPVEDEREEKDQTRIPTYPPYAVIPPMIDDELPF